MYSATSLTGYKHTELAKQKFSNRYINKANHSFFGIHHDDNAKFLIKTKQLIRNSMKKYSNGIKSFYYAVDLADQFKISKVTVELVSGFMTEHAAVIFVLFFLAEYASIVLICILTSILFLGGYLYNYISIFFLMQYFDFDYYIDNLHNESLFDDRLIEGLLYGLALGVKSCFMIFVFI
ncbi:hypothetical protein HYALB_00013232 [Hymenoscyphus albidus]|uniref:Uncharacterized protein n=1 Tax=Hymenoscyphus albidus TaxID=595503 RepID=A0A9N9QBX5_9HELO|nr:hypothetical protein HYALB_00013232 [Hymenoscyphus albidus]